MYKIILTIIGALLGIPLSYFFQSELVRSKFGGVGSYLQKLGDVTSNSDLVGNVIISVVIFAALGLLIGFFIDRSAKQKTT